MLINKSQITIYHIYQYFAKENNQMKIIKIQVILADK